MTAGGAVPGGGAGGGTAPDAAPRPIAVSIAAVLRRLAADLRGWLPIVAVVGIANAVVSSAIADPSAALMKAAEVIATADPSTGTAAFVEAASTWQLNVSAISPFTTVAGWLFGAYAIEAVRGRPATLGGALSAGLRSFGWGLVFASAILASSAILGLLTAIVALPDPVVLALELAWAVVAGFVGLRFLLVAPALFDRYRIGDAVAVSWSATRARFGRFVLRWLPGGLLAGAVGFSGAVAGLVIGTVSPAVGGFIGGSSATLTGLIATLWVTVLYADRVPARTDAAAADRGPAPV